MSLARYRYFEKVARLGSIREAADVLHVAPSAISRQLRILEQEYNVELFERHARGVMLTPAGKELLQAARVLLGSINDATSAIDDLKGLKRGHVRIWTDGGIMGDFVYPVLAAFAKTYPGVTFELMIASTDQIAHRLLEDAIELAVMFNPPIHRNIEVLGEVSDPMMLVGQPSHELATRKVVTLAEAGRWRLALPDETFGTRRLIDQTAATARVELAPTLVTNSVESVRSFVRSGMGVAIMTNLSVMHDVALRRLVAVPIKDRLLKSARVKICMRRGRHLSVAARALAKAFELAARRIVPK